MAKTIAVADDVYQLLSRAKLPGESFSDVIRRGLGRGIKLGDVWGSGTLSREDWLKTLEIVKRAEAETRRRFGKTHS